MRLLLIRYAASVQLPSIPTIQRIMAMSNDGRTISGACFMNNQHRALVGMPGAAQGDA